MRWLAAALALLSAAGCASLVPAPSAHLSSEVRALRDCAEWYRELDERVDAAGVRDAQDSRIAGFPYLRVNRLLSSYRAEAAADQRVLGALVERMQELDIEARRREAANLPAGDAAVRDRLGERMVMQRASGCAAALREADLADPSARAAMLERAAVPDDYSSASRVLGLYAVSRLLFSAGVRRQQQETRASFTRDLSAPPGATLVRYAPPSTAALPRAAVAALLTQGAGNPLGIPELREGELEQLYAAYAPTFEIEVSGDFDRFGALRWLRDSPVPAVNAAERCCNWSTPSGFPSVRLNPTATSAPASSMASRGASRWRRTASRCSTTPCIPAAATTCSSRRLAPRLARRPKLRSNSCSRRRPCRALPRASARW